MRNILKKLIKPVGNEKGVSDLIVLLIVLPTFLAITLMVISFQTFIMRQAKIDDINVRALQMVQTEGYLTQDIIDDTNNKLTAIGFPPVTKNGVSYPSYTGSTMTKVLRDSADPTVRLFIQYPATNLQNLMALIGVTTVEDDGYFYLESYGRSEAYE